MPLTALEQTDAHLDHSPASARSRIARRPAYTLLPNAQHLLRDPRCLAVTTQPWTHANSASKVSAVFFKNNVCNGPAAAACVHARPGCGDGTLTVTARGGQVGYFHGYLDGVDYVFVDHPCFHGRQDNIYGGDRQEARAAPAPACCLCSRSPSFCPARA